MSRFPKHFRRAAGAFLTAAMMLSLAPVSLGIVIDRLPEVNHIAPSHTTVTFSDVAKSSWAHGYIEEAHRQGAVNGYPNGMYLPDSTLSYSELVAMLVKAFYPNDVRNSTETAPWYDRYLTIANKYSLLSGAETDDPTAPVSRFSMATILCNILEDMQVNRLSDTLMESLKPSVGDSDTISQDIWADVATVYAYGIIQGIDSDHSFSGTSYVTRAQAAAIYVRLSTVTGNGTNADYDPTPAAPDGILFFAQKRSIGLGDSLSLAALEYSTYEAPDAPVTYTVSDPSVLRYDGSDVFTAIGLGTCTVTATCVGETATATISVVEPEKVVHLQDPALYASVSEIFTQSLIIHANSYFYNRPISVEWSVSDPSLLSLHPFYDGKTYSCSMTAHRKGIAVVTCRVTSATGQVTEDSSTIHIQ